MFICSYTVDLRRFVRWYAPPVRQQKHFRLWMVILAASVAGTILCHTLALGDRYASLGWLMIFISLYRGLFFDILYARRQFYASCRALGRGQERCWQRRCVAEESGVSCYTEGELTLSLPWEKVELCREDAMHLDFVCGGQTARFEKDGFTQGSAEALADWVRQTHPRIPWESGKPIYLPLA